MVGNWTHYFEYLRMYRKQYLGQYDLADIIMAMTHSNERNVDEIRLEYFSQSSETCPIWCMRRELDYNFYSLSMELQFSILTKFVDEGFLKYVEQKGLQNE